ncbi:MAG: nitronate monooxygenase [Anaerolineae bacterium]
MISTPVCEMLGITHPVFLGPMAGGTNPELVAAVSNAGGLGAMGCARLAPDVVAQVAEQIRQRTARPFAMNLLLFEADAPAIEAVLAARPPVFSTAWAKPTQELKLLFERAHDGGAKVMHMVSTLQEAARAVEAGADVLVAQGTEGGGHVGVMSSIVLVPQVARAVAPVPVIAAGGFADGAGLAAALALGAQGILMGTRFLATPEGPWPGGFKEAIVRSNGHNTLLSEIPDVITGRVWPGAYARVIRNRMMETWLGREGDLRYRHRDVLAQTLTAREAGDAEMGTVYSGQTAGLVSAVEPAAHIVQRVVEEAEMIIRQTLPGMIK